MQTSLSRQGSFTFKDEDRKILVLSSNTGLSSPPIFNHRPSHIVTIYAPPGLKRIQDRPDCTESISDKSFVHCSDIHLHPDDMQPETYKPHYHYLFETQESLKEFLKVASNDKNKTIPVIPELETLMQEAKQNYDNFKQDNIIDVQD